MKTESATVKLSELTIDPSNVRKTGRGEEPKFAASIRARGVLEPLLVRKSPKGDTYLIVNGGERFTALHHLLKKGENAGGVVVNENFPVKVEIADQHDGDARATSLATNLIRSDMHPVDEFEAFAELIKDGGTLDDLAKEYARTVPQIRQALCLAAIAPEIRKAWRDGEIDGEAAEAYAQTKDLEHQARIFKKLPKNRRDEEWAITEEIMGGRDNKISTLLKFVGQKKYESAGHHVNPSLFTEVDERDGTKVDNVPALKAMASAKLAAEIDKLKKDGWGWVVEKDHAPKDLYAWRRVTGNLTKEQKANAGCTVDVNWQGQLEVAKGYVKPGASVKVEKTAAEKAAARKAGPAKPATISAALTTRLSESLTRATASIVAEECDPDMVLRLAVAGIMCSGAFSESPVCLESKGMSGSDDDEIEGHDFPAELKRVGKMARPALQKLFAKMIGGALDLKCYSPERMLVESEGEVEDDGVAALVHFVPPKQLQAALTKEFDANDYFENSPGAMALAALRDVGVEPLKNAKKAALVKQAVDAAKKSGWLPPQLRTAGYAGPKAKAARKKRR